LNVAEQIFGFDKDGAKRMSRALQQTERFPRNFTVQRRRAPVMTPIILPGQSGSCCDPYECVDGVDLTSIYSCAACSTAAQQWHIVVPSGAFQTCCPDATGIHTLTYFGGCIWTSPDFVCNGVITRWVLTIATDVSTLVLDLGADGTICFEKRTPWCCTCVNSMIPCCGPHPDCTQDGSPPWFLCVHPGPGEDAAPPGSVVCGGVTYPGTFTADAGGPSTGSIVYQPGSQVWFGKVRTSAICGSGREWIYITMQCGNDGKVIVSGSVDSNEVSDLCQAIATPNDISGNAVLTGSAPNWGSIDFTTGPDCCLGEGSTVTISFTGVP
jgi:hypothetical protein